jgi:ABC-type nitrate/sulfonate/bicarbonate transport system substrate-binding protein
LPWATKATRSSPTDWAKESFRQAKKVVYNFAGTQQFIDDHGANGVRLDAAYDNRALPVARSTIQSRRPACRRSNQTLK